MLKKALLLALLVMLLAAACSPQADTGDSDTPVVTVFSSPT